MQNELALEYILKIREVLDNILKKKSENKVEIELVEKINSNKTQNSFFTNDEINRALGNWINSLEEKKVKKWLDRYNLIETKKKIGLITAGNIPFVGLHDLICGIITSSQIILKDSSKDRGLFRGLVKAIVYKLKNINLEVVEKISPKNIDALIATGNNNTFNILNHYFKNIPKIIRKNRTSVCLIDGSETPLDINKLGKDIFYYYGLGCRNVNYLIIPDNYDLKFFFKNIKQYNYVIDNNSYHNNYKYNRTIYLMNNIKFLDNNFLILKEDNKLNSNVSELNYMYYKNKKEAYQFVKENKENIQCIVSNDKNINDRVDYGKSQKPNLSDYADKIDTISFLINL